MNFRPWVQAAVTIVYREIDLFIKNTLIEDLFMFTDILYYVHIIMNFL